MSDDTILRRGLLRWEAKPAEAGGARQEKRRLAAAMRVVISRLVETDAPEAELAAAADGLERYAALLAVRQLIRRNVHPISAAAGLPGLA